MMLLVRLLKNEGKCALPWLGNREKDDKNVPYLDSETERKR